MSLMLACVALTALSYSHHTLLRSHGNLGAVSVWHTLQGTIGVLLGLGLIPWFGMRGLLWGWFAGPVIATLTVVWRGRAVVPLPTADSRALLAIGVPIFVCTASNLMMRSLDRVIILKLLGTEALGLYGLAVMAVCFLLTKPDAIATVLCPRLLQRFRQSGDDPTAIPDTVHRAMRALSLFVPALGAPPRARIVFLVRLFLPLAVAIPLAYFFERFFPGYRPQAHLRWLRLLGSAVLWLALYGLIVFPLARGIGFRQRSSEFDRPWSAARRQEGGRG